MGRSKLEADRATKYNQMLESEGEAQLPQQPVQLLPPQPTPDKLIDTLHAIYVENFQKTSDELAKKHPKANVPLIISPEKPRHFARLLEAVRLRPRQARDGPPENRFRARQRQTAEEVIQGLAEMGVEREYAQIALENIEGVDQAAAMEWIDNNRSQVEEQVMARVLARTSQRGEGAADVSVDRFRRDLTSAVIKAWIKFSFRELFLPNDDPRLKDLLFLCMDHLDETTRNKQYTNFNNKIYDDIDALNKEQNPAPKLALLCSLLETLGEKLPRARLLFYERSVNMKALSFLDRIGPEDQTRIFTLLNAYLPVLTADSPPELEEYVAFLLDLLHRHRPTGKAVSGILLKALGGQALVQRVRRTVEGYLLSGVALEGMGGVVEQLVGRDGRLAQVNAELDIKTFLLERYRHRISAFLPDKEHVLEVDIKEFASSFPRYDKNSAIYDVAKRLLAKKKNKNKYFYYDCRKPESAFHFSVVAGADFATFSPEPYVRALVRSLIYILFAATPEAQPNALALLHQILSSYRILLGVALQERVQGKGLVEWLLECPSQSRRKYKLLLFLMLNCNILVPNKDGPYSFSSLADYSCARAVAHLLSRDYSNGDANALLAAHYLQQLRRFSDFCAAPLSGEREVTAVSMFEELLGGSALQRLAAGELLNVHYKRVLLDNLKRKYKIVGSESEPTFERQFLNLTAFYQSLPLKLAEHRPKKPEAPQPPRDMEAEMPLQHEESESDEENNDHVGIRYTLLSNYYNQPNHQNHHQQEPHLYEQLIAPLPIKPPKEGEPQPALEPIVVRPTFTILDILQLFESALPSGQGGQEKVEVADAQVPQRIVKVTEGMFVRLSPQEGSSDLELRVRKNAGFERHFGDLVKVSEPKAVWEERRAPSSFEKRMQEISRRMMSGEHREEMMHQLERLVMLRQREEEAQQPPRLLNATEIYNALPEFTDPILPQQAQVAEQPIQQENRMELEVPIEPVVNQPASEPQPNPIPDFIEDELIANEPMEVEVQPPQQSIPPQPNPIPEYIEEPQQQPQEQLLPQQPPAQEQPQQPVPVEQPQQPEQQAQEVPVVPPVEPQQPQPPIRDREILRIFGLPQTFLRDAGIDEESFDCLPEDFQQEQLMHIISQQNRPSQPSRNANNSNPSNPPPANQGNDLQNDNVAFLASLDILTRAQVLIEATPEFLATLPSNIREEAENYRHQQINRIIEEEEIEEERKMGEQKRQPVQYPKVFKEEFSNIDDSLAKRLFQGVFYSFPGVRASPLQLLLQNKQTQAKTLATIIALLKHLESAEEKKLFSLKKVEWSKDGLNTVQHLEWTAQEVQGVRVMLLHAVYELLTIPFYKDEDLFSEALSTEVYLVELQPLLVGESVDAVIELLDFSWEYYNALSSELLKRVKGELPDRFLMRVVEGIKNNSLPLHIYDSLGCLSDNARLKDLFAEYCEGNTPHMEVLACLMKYNFSKVGALRRIHRQALQAFGNNHHNFYNQIFSIYSVEDLAELEPLVVRHKHVHFEVVKFLLQQGREVEKEPIGLLLKRPQLLDFESKKLIFRNHPRVRKLARHRVHIEVDRAHLFQGSYNQLMSRSVRELEGRIQVSFVNEPGYDAGGLKREWFLVVSREIFNQDYALFEKSSSGSTYQPNPKSYINPDHLNYFKFIGRFIGKALVERELIDAYFTRAFYKMILGQELEFKDLEAQDYEFYKSMEWLKNNPIDQNMFTFSYIYDNFGHRVEKELIPGGKAIVVNEENKMDYIEKYCLAKMRDDFTAQINKFLEGFHEIVPQECISFFEAKELELLISGVPEVDVEDLKKNTDYSGYSPGDQVIVWFWEIVEEYSQEDLAKLVQFITGTSKIPFEGFSHLVGMNGIQRISIHRDPCDHQLPKSHTCFNQLDLPNYPSKDVLRNKLAICLAWGSEGFGFM